MVVARDAGRLDEIKINFFFYSVTQVPEQEVTWFNLDWKVPCVLYWINRDLPCRFCPADIPNPITVDVFSEDKCIIKDRGRKRITFMPLGMDEIPKKGTNALLFFFF